MRPVRASWHGYGKGIRMLPDHQTPPSSKFNQTKPLQTEYVFPRKSNDDDTTFESFERACVVVLFFFFGKS